VAGVNGFILQVDGVTTSLSDDYVSGVPVSPALPDGANNYIAVAAFLSPLAVGQHTLGIGGYIDGQPQVFFSDTINSVPEPASVVLALAGLLSILGARGVVPGPSTWTTCLPRPGMAIRPRV
jgi:hypothetical protein